ncbi:hypothetical protein MACJ_002308 [Theileria orientalis]|uniref:Uncharacterized protein n=1 Tax=Theileria orientalis TaxID=68886 RepID=A0A976M8C7_THEOR|nr:hypothetical protein MACJ_002308 [Theileria orientalis]
MSINFITKCLFIYSSLIYSKNLVESADTFTTNPSGGGTKSEHNFKEVNSKEWPSNIKLFERDSDDNTKTVELPNDKYKVKQDENNNDLFQYEFNDGVNCTLIKNDDKDVWKYDSSKHSGKYPKSFTCNIKDSKIILKCTDLFIVCEKEGDNYKDTEFNKKTPHELSLKDKKDTDQFEYKKDGKIVTFTANGDYAFNSVKRGEEILWQTDDESEYAGKVVLNGKGDKKKKEVTIYKLNNYKVLCVREDKNKPWQSFDLSKTNAVSINIGFTSDSFKYTNKLEGETRTFEAKDRFIFNHARCYINKNWIDIWKTDKENEYANKIVNEGESTDTSTSKTGVDLNITTESSTNEFEYKKDGNYVTYTPKGNNAFKLVKDRKSEIWKESSASNYSLRVEVDNIFGDSKVVTVYLGDDKTKVFKKDHLSTEWEEIDLTIVIPKLINIKYESETYFYKTELNNNVRTITAKKGFSFKGAHEYVDGKKIEIWKTDKENEYSNKIEVEGNRVTIHTGEGNNSKKKILEKRTGKWHEACDGGTGGTDSSGQGSEFKSGDCGSSEGYACSTLGSDYTSSLHVYSEPADGGSSAGKAAEVCDPNLSSTDTSSTAAPAACGSSNIFSTILGWLSFCGSSCISKTSSESQFSSSATKNYSKIHIYLDISSDTDSTDQFDYKRVDQYVTYSAKDNYAFKLVKDDETELWEATGPSDYSSKVEVDLINNGSRAVTVFMGDGKTRIFKKDDKSGPWNEFCTTIVNPKSINIDYPYESYFYRNALKNDIRTFEAKDGFVFNIVYRFIDENNRVIIWKTDNQDEYAKKILTEGDNKVTINIGEGTSFTKVFIKGYDGTWKEDTACPTPKTGVDLNIKSDKKTTKKFEYKKDGQYVTYTAKDNYAFKLVKDNRTQVWKASRASDYSNRIEVELMGKSNAVTIYFPGNKTKVFKKHSETKSWKEINLFKVNFRSVDINYPYESYFSKNELQGNARTFTAKNGFAFKFVYEFIDKTNRPEIWKTDNESEYANKVVNEENKKVTIYIGDDVSPKVFNKRSDGTWTEDTSASKESSGTPPSGGGTTPAFTPTAH